jgi:hypothetical protein
MCMSSSSWGAIMNGVYREVNALDIRPVRAACCMGQAGVNRR